MSQFRLADWIVPPVIVPLFLLLLVLAVAVFRG
jgi:hypothetical protein